MQPIPDKPVCTVRFSTAEKLNTRLNELATKPGNRWDLKFLTESKYGYTAVFCWVPETTE